MIGKFALPLLGGLLLTLSLAGCNQNAMTPASSTATTPQAEQDTVQQQNLIEMLQKMRTWQQSLSPQDRKTLDTTGEIAFSYETLKTTDPAHAKLADELFKALKPISLPSSDGNEPKIDLGTLETVGFTKNSPEKYSFIFETSNGSSFRFGLTPDTEDTPPGK